MPLTKIQPQNIKDYTIDTAKLSNTATVAFTQTLAPKITSVNVANSSYTILDDTAVDTAGGYIVINGSEFQSGATVFIDTTQATAVTYVNSTTLRAQVPAKSASSYNLYVINPDGGFGIRVNGITYSTLPTWVTTSPLANKEANVAFNLSFNATGATTYSNTTALPAGTTLLANGYFYGTVTIGANTTYSFTVVATDAELQDSNSTFSVTFTVVPKYELWLWGANNYGQLGLNDRVYRSSPTQVGSGTNWSMINSGRQNTGAIKNDGTLWTWGSNTYGKLGHNNVVDRSSPVQVGSGTDWNSISSSQGISIVIKTNGTLWAWGVNTSGQLGLNDLIYRSSPVQIGTSTNWSKIDNSFQNCIATKTDGTLWAWGLGDSNGQLGLNDRVNRSSPTQVGSGTTWNLISGGAYLRLATKTDGTLWAWGRNNYGQLGLNDRVTRSSPTQVGTGTTWNLISGGRYNSISTKTDNTLWMWGDNTNGELGLNDVVNRSSPVQVGSSANWTSISGGDWTHTISIKTV